MKQLRKMIVALIACALMLSAVPADITESGIHRATVEASTKASYALTVKKVDTSLAKKVHERLYQGKPLTLKVKGSAKASLKLIEKLEKKIKKTNKLDVIFQYETGATKEGYTTYTVSSDNAKLYKYSVKFVQKLWNVVKEKYNQEIYSASYPDYVKYPDEEERAVRTAYDYLTAQLVKYNPSPYSLNFPSYDSNLITQKVYFEYPGQISSDYPQFNGISEKSTLCADELIRNHLGESSIDYTDLLIKSIEVKDGNLIVNVMSYKEFKKDKTLHNYYKYDESKGSFYENYFIKNADYILYETKNFCDLSDAMKIYALDISQYFNSNYAEYSMKYSYTGSLTSKNHENMKILYENKAAGVCSSFASMERLLFDQFGITNYYNASGMLNHAWSVVKVENSAGKTLWIPFDYGIGPSGVGDVTDEEYDRYLSTETKRYKLYLGGIPGAPKKRNFTYRDFY